MIMMTKLQRAVFFTYLSSNSSASLYVGVGATAFFLHRGRDILRKVKEMMGRLRLHRARNDTPTIQSR